MLKNKKLLVLTSIITLLPVLAGLLLWDRLPETIPIHWNVAGEIDGYGSRAMVVFGLFGFLLLMHWVCIAATALDPKNKAQGAKAAALVLWIVPVISVVMAMVVYATALGVTLSVNVILPIFLGLVFVVVGNLMPKCRQNYTIGIKVPWTLDDVDNWNATHRFAGRIWIAGGLFTMATALLGNIPIMLAVLLMMSFAPMVYSYLYYKKHKKED